MLVPKIEPPINAAVGVKCVVVHCHQQVCFGGEVGVVLFDANGPLFGATGFKLVAEGLKGDIELLVYPEYIDTF